MDRFEEKLKDSLTKKIKLPNEYKYIIRNALYKENEEKRRRHRFIKILAMSCTFLLLITSVVGAVNLSRYIYNYYSDNKGMDEAIKEGYIDESNMEYVASSNVEEIEAVNTEIKIKDMLMDDHNLSFTFSVKLDENIDMNKINTITFPDMIIYDENNTLIYCDSRDRFNEFCTNNNLQYEFSQNSDNYIANEQSSYIKDRYPELSTIDVVYNFNTMVYSYPKCKKLYIDLKKINISESEAGDSIGKIINGEWKIDYDVSEKFYNRETLMYNVKSCSDERLNITEAYVTETGMVYDFTFKDEPMLDGSETVEESREKILNFPISTVFDEYVENENGEKFYHVQGNMESSGTIYSAYGDFEHWQTFDLIKSKATNKLTLYFSISFHGHTTENVVVELEKR